MRARDSGRQHNAWGVSPRTEKLAGGSGEYQLTPVSRAPKIIHRAYLGLTPQALCWCPFSRAPVLL